MNEAVTPGDIKERLRALDPARSFVVQAPAGSGKTTLLTQRFLRLLATVEEPESIIAITFTVKAAEEMRGRILNALRTAAEPAANMDAVTFELAEAVSARDAELNWGLLANPRRLRVMTIDALAAQIARRNPINGGLGAATKVTDDAYPLYREAAQQVLATLEDDSAWSRDIATLLRHMDNDWPRLENLLVDMLSRREQWLGLITAEPRRDVVEQAIAAAIGLEIEALADALPSSALDDLVEVAAYAGTNAARDDPSHPLAVLEALSAMPLATVEQLDVWRAIGALFLTNKGTFRQRLTKREGFPPGADNLADKREQFVRVVAILSADPHLERQLSTVASLPAPVYRHHEWRFLEALFSVLKLAAAELHLTFDARGAIDFAAVTHAAVTALGAEQDPSDLTLALDHKIHHLLIDEFQDTSATQHDLIARLLDGWTGSDGRSLFLVGDPMQSIYRFRQAEVELFRHAFVYGRFSSIPLESVQLTANFRSRPAVVSWISENLSAVATTVDHPFRNLPPVEAVRDAGTGKAVKIHACARGDEEASAVVDIVLHERARQPDCSIGILVRGRRHVGAISRQLGRAGIGVNAADVEQLAEQPWVQDLAALARALLHRADRVAWFAILRAPWCGLSLRSMNSIARVAAPTIWQALEHIPSDDLTEIEYSNLVRVREIITDAQLRVGRQPIGDIVLRAWHALNGPHVYDDLDVDQVHSVLALFDDLERSDRTITPATLDTELANRFVAPAINENNGVQIMTIHRAKGLEFDVVIIPGLDRPPRAEPRRLLNWRAVHDGRQLSLLFAPIPEVGASDDSLHRYLATLERRELHEESHRLLYVALTRARDAIHLIGDVAMDADGALVPPRNSTFLSMLWAALEPRFAPMVMNRADLEKPIERSDEPQASAKRLDWSDIPVSVTQRGHNNDAELADVEFSWASPIAKHIGTITHAILQRVSRDGAAHWNANRVSTLDAYVHTRLSALGVPRSKLEDASQRVLDAVARATSSPRGRWILDNEHRDAESEYALIVLDEDRPSHVIIDRTFVVDDVRWIIDYKTGVHGGGDRNAFVDSEVERYRDQLERYAAIFQRRDPQPIALGLFFPLLDEWREWRYDNQ